MQGTPGWRTGIRRKKRNRGGIIWATKRTREEFNREGKRREIISDGKPYRVKEEPKGLIKGLE